MASVVGNTGTRDDGQVPVHAGAAPRTLVYVLNSYSAREASHFAHTLPLLRAIADRGIEVHLLIEKADGLPEPIRRRRQVGIEVVVPRRSRLEHDLAHQARHGHDAEILLSRVRHAAALGVAGLAG